MSDSEYESEDDEDYIPEEPSSEEDVGVVEEIVKKKRKKINKPSSRKRKGGIHLEEGEEASNHEESDDEIEDKLEGENAQAGEKEKLTSKRRMDDIWAAFKEETAAVRLATSSCVKHKAGKTDVKSREGEVKALKSSTVETRDKETPKKVEITEIFDFAGEEVKVVKSVDASSVKPAVSSNESNDALKPKTALLVKRPGGGLGSVLGKIGKKPKLSTLEKSKLDWDSFKKEKGIEEELKTSNRDGYLEKQAFLSRVDHKQFEHERDIRQGFRKR